MDNTGGVVSVIKEITAEGSVLNLFNYGLLTAVHVVPGFISFVAMRYVFASLLSLIECAHSTHCTDLTTLVERLVMILCIRI